MILSCHTGVFLIDSTTEVASIPLLYAANSLAFSRLWFLCVESSHLQYAACLQLQLAVSAMEQADSCLLFRKEIRSCQCFIHIYYFCNLESDR